MARIKNIDLPKNKRIVVALTYIYGIGPARAHEICTLAKVNEDTRTDDLTVEEIKAIIGAEGITYGIDNELIEMLALPTKTYEYAIEIAHGKDPVQPVDAYIEYTYDPDAGVKTPTAKEDGSVDLFELNLITNVKKDEVLIEIYADLLQVDYNDVLQSLNNNPVKNIIKAPKIQGIIIDKLLRRISVKVLTKTNSTGKVYDSAYSNNDVEDKDYINSNGMFESTLVANGNGVITTLQFKQI